YPCELDELRTLADRHGLALIGDSCEALGAEYRGAPLGSQGVSCVFAFYPNKQLTTGEGGMVVTHSEEEWHLIRSLRNQGRPEPAPPPRTPGRAGAGGRRGACPAGLHLPAGRHRGRARDRREGGFRRNPPPRGRAREPLLGATRLRRGARAAMC